MIMCYARLIGQVEDIVLGVNSPISMVINGDDLYVARDNLSASRGVISKIDLTLTNSISTDLPVDGIGYPYSMVFKENDLYIAHGDKISKIDITESTLALTDVISGLNPHSMAFKENDLYIAEFGKNRVVKINVTETAPITVDVIAEISRPIDIVFDEDELYVISDHVVDGSSIYKIDVTSSEPVIDRFLYPEGGAISMLFKENDLYVVEHSNRRISKVDANLTQLPVIIATGLNYPLDIVLYGDDIYIAELTKISKVNTNSLLSVNNNPLKQSIEIYPNPSASFIKISGLTNNKETYKIYNTMGLELGKGVVSQDEKIDIKDFANGLYLIKLNEKNISKFIKQ